MSSEKGKGEKINQEYRELSAIMFADLVDYAGLMQNDEPRAREIRQSAKDLIKQVVSKARGRIIHHYGNGALCTFSSTVGALKAAKEIQQTIVSRRDYSLKIGVHSGDVVYSGKEIVGDGVNIAARLQTLSVAGSVLFSEKVYDDIKNHGSFTPVFLGDFEFKNVELPVKVFALGNEGLSIPRQDEIRTRRSPYFNSVAVLPFANLSGNEDHEYLSDGLTDEIIDALSHINQLKVISRTSSFAYKDKHEDVRKIGQKLGVASVLEGSVKSSGNRIRVSARLVNTADGYQVWSDVFNRPFGDLFELQHEIASRIAEQLRANFKAGDSKRNKSAPTQNIEAYNVYLKGKYHWINRSVNETRKAIALFEESIALEPGFGLAYSNLASCYAYLGAYGQMPAPKAYPRARKFALKALDIDNKLAESHIALALVEFFYELDWNKAGLSFRKALQLNPGSAEAHHTYSWYLSAIGKHNEAINEIKIALRLDPLSLSIHTYLGEAHYYAGNREEAFREFNKVLEQNPNHKSALELKGWILGDEGDFEESLKVWKKLKSLSNHRLKGITGLGIAYARMGNKEQARKYIELLKEREKKEPDISLNMDFAAIYTMMGAQEKALDHLEKAFEERYGIFSMNVLPVFELLWEHPRFKKLMKQIKKNKVGEQALVHQHEEANNSITFKSEINEYLTLDPADLIYVEAEGNYSKVVWLDKETVKSKLLRIVIKHLENQIISPFIVRCHRSYLINLKREYKVSGNSRGYKLKPEKVEIEIPVSRNKGKEIVEQLNAV